MSPLQCAAREIDPASECRAGRPAVVKTRPRVAWPRGCSRDLQGRGRRVCPVSRGSRKSDLQAAGRNVSGNSVHDGALGVTLRPSWITPVADDKVLVIGAGSSQLIVQSIRALEIPFIPGQLSVSCEWQPRPAPTMS